VNALRRVWIVLAALSCSGTAAAQSDTAPADVERYRSMIAREKTDNSETSAVLIEQLQSLGLLYHEQSNFAQAAEAFAEARHILRVNDGFESPRELELLAQQLRAVAASGDVSAAWEVEQALVLLARHHLGAPETFAIFQDLAADRYDLLTRYRAGASLQQVELGCYYSVHRYAELFAMYGLRVDITRYPQRECVAGDRRMVERTLLVEAQIYQSFAIEALVRNGRYASDELQELATSLLRTSDRFGRYITLYPPGEYIAAGTMRRILSYAPQSAEEEQRRARLQLLLADQNVLRVNRLNRSSAREFDTIAEQYEQAYRAFASGGLGQAALDDLFAPVTPVALPAFNANPLTGVDTTQAIGHIDVRFDLTRRGTAERVEIVETSEGITRAEQGNLVQLIEGRNFRPMLVEGRVAEATPVTLRYYVAR
jgi:hypothetical protein